MAPNLLRQDFEADAPNLKWVCDITYLRTAEGWLYLAVLIDLFSRMVVGWCMDKHMKAKLVCDALQMALWRRRMPKGVMQQPGSRWRRPTAISRVSSASLLLMRLAMDQPTIMRE